MTGYFSVTSAVAFHYLHLILSWARSVLLSSLEVSIYLLLFSFSLNLYFSLDFLLSPNLKVIIIWGSLVEFLLQRIITIIIFVI